MSKVERIVHNPVDLVVEVPRPVVVEKSVQARSRARSLAWSLGEMCEVWQSVVVPGRWEEMGEMIGAGNLH